MSPARPAQTRRPRLLYVSDLTYQAKGRRYCEEDIFLSAALQPDFDIALCSPLAARNLFSRFDLVVIRNSGPVTNYMAEYELFRADAHRRGARVSPELAGKGDQQGKQYLLDLYAAGYPVIPTVESAEAIDQLPNAKEFIVKPKYGADSIGLMAVKHDELAGLQLDNVLFQPLIDFQYEVSFYFLDRQPQYALSAPHPDRRWDLERYAASDADWEFAQQFVDWNAIDHGIQRVDACRTQEGGLLLVELEDLNPYLSLELLEPNELDRFIENFKRSLHAQLSSSL